jgi:hypothetical protein
MPNGLMTKPPEYALAVYPDSSRYKCIFEIASESSDSKYRVSFDLAPNAGYWVCSCRGNLRHGQCKHLTSMGLQGRIHGKNHRQIAQFALSAPVEAPKAIPKLSELLNVPKKEKKVKPVLALAEPVFAGSDPTFDVLG